LAGDAPSLRIVNSSGITGSQLSASVTTLQQGSTALFYAPIPGDMLRVPAASNASIQLAVNGVLAACGVTWEGSGVLSNATAARSGVACSFSTSYPAATPVLLAVAPDGILKPDSTLVSRPGGLRDPARAALACSLAPTCSCAAGQFCADSCTHTSCCCPLHLQAITLTGTGFSRVGADNVILLGSTACQKATIMQHSASDPTSATKLSCGVDPATVAGVRKVSEGPGYREVSWASAAPLPQWGCSWKLAVPSLHLHTGVPDSRGQGQRRWQPECVARHAVALWLGAGGPAQQRCRHDHAHDQQQGF
jgi:hypothetical protein